MVVITPPPSLPRVALDEQPSGRLNLRIKQILWTTATVLLTAWFCTMGPLPAILALVVAKHVLVAILMMSLGVDRRR